VGAVPQKDRNARIIVTVFHAANIIYDYKWYNICQLPDGTPLPAGPMMIYQNGYVVCLPWCAMPQLRWQWEE
jgi:hypothetical protein